MSTDINEQLQAAFPLKEIFWRRGMHDSINNKARALPYVTPRIVQERLDEVIGPFNWTTKFSEVYSENKLVAARCCLSLRINSEWISREDIAAFSSEDVGLKLLYSEAFKRAAVQFGVGRYLYAYPGPYLPLDEEGNFITRPELPPELLRPEDRQFECEGEVQAKNKTENISEQNTQNSQDAPVQSEASVEDGPETTVQAKEDSSSQGSSLTSPANLPQAEADLVAEMLEKIEGPKAMNPSLIVSYLNGAKAKEKMSEQTRTFLLNKVKARQKANQS